MDVCVIQTPLDYHSSLLPSVAMEKVLPLSLCVMSPCLLEHALLSVLYQCSHFPSQLLRFLVRAAAKNLILARFSCESRKSATACQLVCVLEPLLESDDLSSLFLSLSLDVTSCC